MKKNFLFAMAMAAVFAGCSSDDDPVANAGGEVTGEGYVALGINLPTVNSTRAANDHFDDGLTSEYEVKDATLILFSGADESTATISAAYNISTEPWSTNADDQITVTSKKVVQQVTSIAHPQALVVLNHNNTMTATGNDLLVNSTSVIGKTLSEFLALTDVTSGKTLNENGFYMANAPLSNKIGGATSPLGAKITTLVPVTIYESKAAADVATPSQIYVERANAKVTMTKTDGNLSDNTTISYVIDGWAIDNYNSVTDLVRNTDGFTDWLDYTTNKSGETNYRFVGSDDVETTGQSYRTYFAKDVNYSGEASPALVSPDVKTYNTEFGADKPAYCFENTFNVENQKDNQTTRVVVKAKLNGGNTFYLINGDKTVLYTEETLKTAIIDYHMGNAAMNAWLVANHKAGEPEITAADFEVTLVTTGTTTTFTVAPALTLAAKLSADYATAPTVDLSTYVKVECYENGYSYYTIRIKHFGDDLTPWDDGETTTPSASEIYPSANAEKNYLGRYGVLRNNWYDINVTGIRNIGDPEVPAVNGDWDDEKEAYIVCQINVLSWAKRTQDVEL